MNPIKKVIRVSAKFDYIDMPTRDPNIVEVCKSFIILFVHPLYWHHS